MNNLAKTSHVKIYRAIARKNGNACVRYPQTGGALFKVAFYNKGKLLKVSLEKSFKKPLIVENIDVLTNETLRVLINAFIKRALNAE